MAGLSRYRAELTSPPSDPPTPQTALDPACLKAGATCATPDPPKEKKGFIGGGFDYSPGQGVRPIASVQYSITVH